MSGAFVKNGFFLWERVVGFYHIFVYKVYFMTYDFHDFLYFYGINLLKNISTKRYFSNESVLLNLLYV